VAAAGLGPLAPFNCAACRSGTGSGRGRCCPAAGRSGKLEARVKARAPSRLCSDVDFRRAAGRAAGGAHQRPAPRRSCPSRGRWDRGPTPARHPCHVRSARATRAPGRHRPRSRCRRALKQSVAARRPLPPLRLHASAVRRPGVDCCAVLLAWHRALRRAADAEQTARPQRLRVSAGPWPRGGCSTVPPRPVPPPHCEAGSGARGSGRS